MKQSRAMSLVESIINIAFGFGLSIGCQAIFLPLLGVPIPWQANLVFALVMTVVSIVRQFCLRRIFEALNIRRPLSPAMNAVISERVRQIEAEGWSLLHDDGHLPGDLALAGGCYAISHTGMGGQTCPQPSMWPWARQWWKPRDFRRDLVRAAALIIAEIEKFDRYRKPKPSARTIADPPPVKMDLAMAQGILGLTAEEMRRLTDAAWHSRAELIFPGPALDKARRFAS